jgi:hypothetical protein
MVNLYRLNSANPSQCSDRAFAFAMSFSRDDLRTRSGASGFPSGVRGRNGRERSEDGADDHVAQKGRAKSLSFWREEPRRGRPEGESSMSLRGWAIYGYGGPAVAEASDLALPKSPKRRPLARQSFGNLGLRFP